MTWLTDAHIAVAVIALAWVICVFWVVYLCLTAPLDDTGAGEGS